MSSPETRADARRGYVIEKGRIRYRAPTEALRADPAMPERYIAV